MNNLQSEYYGIKINEANDKYIITILSNQLSRKNKPTASIIGLVILFAIIGYPLYSEILDKKFELIKI